MAYTYLYHWDDSEWIDRHSFLDNLRDLSLDQVTEMIGESSSYSQQIIKLAQDLGGLPAVAEVLGIEVRKIKDY